MVVRKIFLMLPRNHAGGNTRTFPLMDKENFLDFSTLKEMMISTIR
jgi:hypothetical protein